MKSRSSLWKVHGGSFVALWLLLFFTVVVTAGENLKPKHPRPQFKRYKWLNLNGQWDFEFDFDVVGVEKGWAKDPSGYGESAEQEVNGVYTYGRRRKFNSARLKKYFGAPAAMEKGGN